MLRKMPKIVFSMSKVILRVTEFLVMFEIWTETLWALTKDIFEI